MTYEKIIDIDKSELNYYNRLLNDVYFDDDSKEMQDIIKKLDAVQDDIKGLFRIDFENGNYLTIDICSGNSNYYDNVVLFNKDGIELLVCDCDYEIGNEIEINYKNDTYLIKWNIKDEN